MSKSDTLISIFASIRDRPRFDSARSRAIHWLAEGHVHGHLASVLRGQDALSNPQNGRSLAGNPKMARALVLALLLGAANGFGGTSLPRCLEVGGYEVDNYQNDCDPDEEIACDLFIGGKGKCVEILFLAGGTVSYQCTKSNSRRVFATAKSRPPRHRRDASTPGSLVDFVHRPLLSRSSAPAASVARVCMMIPRRSSPSAPDIQPRLSKPDRTAGAASGKAQPPAAKLTE